jgi:hypothetical protein
VSDLLDTIDTAAASLLDAAGFGAKVEGVETPKVELTDRVKAFQAVVDWAKTRSALKPPETGKSKFDAIRDKFRDPPKRRGRGAAPESGPEPAAPADSTPDTNGAGLFDA